jgi:thiamine transport system permease protein
VDRDRAALTNQPPLRLPVWLRAVLVAPPLVFLAVFYAWPVITLLAEVVRGSTVADTLGRPGLGRVLWFTTWQAALSTTATVAVGMAPAYLLARWHFPGRRALAAVVVVPFLLPTVVVGAAFTRLLPDRLLGTATAIVRLNAAASSEAEAVRARVPSCDASTKRFGGMCQPRS